MVTSPRDMRAQPAILYCHCANAKVLPADTKSAVLQTLADSGLPFVAVPDLCALSARKDPSLQSLAGGVRLVAACYPRAVRALFQAAEATLTAEARVLNLRVESAASAGEVLREAGPAGVADETGVDTPHTANPEAAPSTIPEVFLDASMGQPALDSPRRMEVVTACLEAGYAVRLLTRPWQAGVERAPTAIVGRWGGQASGYGAEMAALDLDRTDIAGFKIALAELRQRQTGHPPDAWKPWFPVVDPARCTNCLQCLSFCLFGVYGVDAERRIQVQEPENCKTNCPACARVCPEAAIIFPKHAASPINGNEVSTADVQQEPVKVDLSALLGGDLYGMLRERNARAQSRFSLERDPDHALQERRKCLAALQRLGDIPPEVLMALPSPAEIERRAQAALARAKAAGGAIPPQAKEPGV